MKNLLLRIIFLVAIGYPALLPAQTREGQIISGSLALGSGKSVPLPEGDWRVFKKDNVDGMASNTNANHMGYLLENTNKNHGIPYLLVQDSVAQFRWSNYFSEIPSNSLQIERYGTTASTLVTKVSYLQLSSSLSDRDYGQRTFLKLGLDLDQYKEKTKQDFVISNVRIINPKDSVWYRYLVKLPNAKSSDDSGTNQVLKTIDRFNHQLTDAIYLSYNEKKPQEPIAFETTSSSPATAQTAPQEPLMAQAKPNESKPVAVETKIQEQPAKVLPPAQPLSKADQLAQLQMQMTALKAELDRAAPNKSQPATPLSNRRALVIGNNKYAHVPALENAADDAVAMAESLRNLNFDVTLKTNVVLKEMNAAIRHFKSGISKGDEVVFFYAGHGVQIGQSNFLLPIDITGESEDQIRDDAVLLDRVLDDISEKKAKFTLAMLDACRDNPFKKAGRSIGGGTRGLAPASTANGQMIIFSAGAGQQALDKLGPSDKDKNGLFTRVFIREMQKPGVSIDRVVRNVRNQVVDLARSVKHDQVPAIYDQVIGEFYFKP